MPAAPNRSHPYRGVRRWSASASSGPLHYDITAQAEAEDARDAETFGASRPHKLPTELADAQHRLKQVTAALAEIERVAIEGETLPSRIPITDPQSRVTPNKEGGFAPNYTPLATVDAAQGFIVAADVIAMTNEDAHLVKQLEAVQSDFSLKQLPTGRCVRGLT